MVAREVTPFKTIVPGYTTDEEVSNGGITDTLIQVFIGIFVSKTEEA